MTYSNRANKTKVLLSFIILIVGASYAPSLKFDFVHYDDNDYVINNKMVRNGFSWESVKTAFNSFYASNWHPLTWLSHMLDFELYGLHPSGHHFTNILFHAANTALLFLILMRMTGELWKSAFAAVVFGIHPLNVESVAWISERKNLLSTFFAFLAIMSYIEYAGTKNLKQYTAAALFFALGLMAKPMIVALPLALLLLDYWPLNRIRYRKANRLSMEKKEKRLHIPSRCVYEKIPLCALSAMSCVLTVSAQHGGGAVVPVSNIPLDCRLINAMVSYATYIIKYILPFNLAVFYPHPGCDLSIWKIAGSILLLTVLVYWSIKKIVKFPYLMTGFLWFLGMLVPVIGIIQVGGQAYADRYIYLPIVGLSLMLAWGLGDFVKRNHSKRKPIYFFTAILLVILNTVMIAQLAHWKNMKTLFTHSLRVTKNNWIAHNNLGVAFLRENKLKKAVNEFKTAVKIYPAYAQAYYNLGRTYQRMGNDNLSGYYFRTAIQYSPDYINAHMAFADLLMQKGDFEKAWEQYDRVLKVDPANAMSHHDIAVAYLRMKKPEKAVHHFLEAVKSAPLNARFHYALGRCYLDQNRIDKAMARFSKTIEIDPKYADAYKMIGAVLRLQGKERKAIVFLEKAEELGSVN